MRNTALYRNSEQQQHGIPNTIQVKPSNRTSLIVVKSLRFNMGGGIIGSKRVQFQRIDEPVGPNPPEDRYIRQR
jgi:hypothetical protein